MDQMTSDRCTNRKSYQPSHDFNRPIHPIELICNLERGQGGFSHISAIGLHDLYTPLKTGVVFKQCSLG